MIPPMILINFIDNLNMKNTQTKIKIENKRVPWLDLLRFLSAFIVVVAHCRVNFFAIFSQLDTEYQTFSTKIFYLLTSFSDDAVFVFFLLSGFLVGGGVLNSIFHREQIDWRRFVISRFVRILIPLFASLLLCVLVYYLEGKTPSYVNIIGNAFSLQGAFVPDEGGVLWTMPYIVWSYVFLLSLILIDSKIRKNQIIGLGVFCITISLFLLFPHPKCFLCVALGALSFFIRRIKFPKWFLALSLLVAALTALIAKFAKPSMSRDVSMFSFVNLDVLNFIEAFFIAILLSHIVKINPKRNISIKLEKIGSKLSVFSYSLYLSHYPLIKIMLWLGFPRSTVVDLSSVSFFIFVILLCVGLGYVFYLFFEKPTGIFRKWLLRKLAV